MGHGWVGCVSAFVVNVMRNTDFIDSAAFQQTSKHETLRPYWISAWQSAARVMTSVSLSRAACHLMHVLLKLEIVPFTAVSEIVQSMLLSIELSGPALLTESSSLLLTTVIKERIIENPTYHNQTAERVLNWLISKWTPSKRLCLNVAYMTDTNQVFGLNVLTLYSTPATAAPAMYYVYSARVLIGHIPLLILLRSWW